MSVADITTAGSSSPSSFTDLSDASSIKEKNLNRPPISRQISKIIIGSIGVSGLGIALYLASGYREELLTFGREVVNEISSKEKSKQNLTGRVLAQKSIALSYQILFGGVCHSALKEAFAPFKDSQKKSVKRMLSALTLGLREGHKKIISFVENQFFSSLNMQQVNPPVNSEEGDEALIASLLDVTQRNSVEITDNTYVSRTAIENDIFAGLGMRATPSVMLVGEPGSGKSSIIAGISSGLKNKQTKQPCLQTAEMIEVKLGEFFMKGDGLQNVMKFSEQFQKDNKVRIIFIDEFNIIGEEGDDSARMIDALKPLLARGNLRMLVCTTPDMYHKIDPAFARRFTVVNIPEPSGALLKEVLKKHIQTLEEHHQCTYEDSVVEDVIELTQSFPGSHPAKGIGVLDLAASLAWSAKADQESPLFVSKQDIEKAISKKV